MKHLKKDHQRVRRLAGATVVGVGVALMPAAGFAGSAVADDPVGARPGDVVSAEPSGFELPPGLPTDTAAWKIHYRSTAASGAANVVSGTVVVPKDGRTGVRPLLTYAVGTVGMGDQCAPSVSLPEGGSGEALLLNEALRRGWAVVVTDYEGLGTPGDHTYTVGRAEGTAVLDAARAVQRLPEARRAGVEATSPVAVMGYSQGGQATAWAAELAAGYAPELQIKGVASGGVPADLLASAPAAGAGESAAATDNVALSLMTAIGHDAAYPELELDSYLNAEGRDLVAKMREGCAVENAQAGDGKTLEQLTVKNPLQAPDWRQRLGADRLGSRGVKPPVALYHGTADQVVPYAAAEKLRADWCGRGSTVQWQPFPLADHMVAYVLGGGLALDWLADRVAGEPTRGNCG